MMKKTDIMNTSDYINEPLSLIRPLLASIFVSVLFFGLNYSGNSVYFYVGVLFFAIIAILFPLRDNLLVSAFCIPNLYMFKMIGSTDAILGYFFLLVSGKYIISQIPKKKVPVNGWFVLHIVFVLFTTIYYADTSLATRLLRFVFSFVLFSKIMVVFSTDKEMKSLVYMYILGVITAVVLGVLFHSSRGNLYNGLFAGVNSGRNYFEAVISPVITIVVLYILDEKINGKELIVYITAIFASLISLILSGSRTAVLCLAFPMLMIFMSAFRVKRIRRFALLSCIIAAAVIYIYFNYTDSITSIVSRFSEGNISTGNRRFELWAYYLKESFSNVVVTLIGNGSLSASYAVGSVHLVAHNTIIESLHTIGLLGTIPLFFSFAYEWRISTNGKVYFYSLFSLFVVVFSYFGINGLYADQLTFLLFLCLLIRKQFSDSLTE